jgi:hypothetical protein
MDRMFGEFVEADDDLDFEELSERTRLLVRNDLAGSRRGCSYLGNRGLARHVRPCNDNFSH